MLILLVNQLKEEEDWLWLKKNLTMIKKKNLVANGGIIVVLHEFRNALLDV